MDAMTHFSAEDVARILHATEPSVRTWARMGGVIPKRGPDGGLRFTFQQLLLLRTTRGLLEAGVSPRRVRRVWSSLRRQLSDDRPLTSIRILADGNRAVAWDGNAPWQPDSGQFLLDFDAREIAGAPEIGGPVLGVIHGGEREDPEEGGLAADASLTAEQWFRLGCELEIRSPIEAREAYLRAIAVDPKYADAHLNLGRLDHGGDALGSAEARYRRAIECAPDDATAHFNLGVLLEDRNCPHAAAESYERAIACDPDFADAHYNLGLVLEELGRRADAMRHLMAAHRLYLP